MYVKLNFYKHFNNYRHDVELRKVKEVQAAAEKLRRERWIDEKTKKIKVDKFRHYAAAIEPKKTLF